MYFKSSFCFWKNFIFALTQRYKVILAEKNYKEGQTLLWSVSFCVAVCGSTTQSSWIQLSKELSCPELISTTAKLLGSLQHLKMFLIQPYPTLNGLSCLGSKDWITRLNTFFFQFQHNKLLVTTFKLVCWLVCNLL